MTKTRKLVVVIDKKEVDELVILFGKSASVDQKPTTIKRCLALKRTGVRCGHTSRTATISSEGLCTCSHRLWRQLAKPTLPMAMLWVVE